MTYFRFGLTALFVAALVAQAPAAFAIDETITDIKIRENNRTSEDTIRAMAGADIGDDLESDTLEMIRERLNNSGMFADVDVFWEPYKGGARIVITVREKFPWAPVPTFSLSPGNISFGAVLVHGNLWGRGKQGLIGGRISNVNSGAVLGYRDPALLGTWMYWEFQGVFKDQTIPEFATGGVYQNYALRENELRSLGVVTRFGVFWWRRVRTEVGWDFTDWKYRGYRYYDGDTKAGAPPALAVDPGAGAQSATVGEGMAALRFDYRAREHAIVTGNAFGVSMRLGSPQWGSDKKIDYWKLGGEYMHGLRLLRRINWINSAGFNVGERMPLWSENWAGGANLRGYQYMRFRGDTHAYFESEFHFPLFSISQLDVRALGFYDLHSVWWRNQDPLRTDGRNFLGETYQPTGFKVTRDIHHGVGGGLRFYLRTVAVPLVGVDYGYGIEDGVWRLVLVVGA